jgi:hypothetical protein
MEPNEGKTTQLSLAERFRKSWFPPTAVAGAFVAFVAAALRVRPTAKVTPVPAEPFGPAKPAEQPAQPIPGLEREYTLSAVLGSAASAHPFRRSLAGIAVGAKDTVYALGDDEIRIFEANGNLVRNWKAPENAACLTVGPDQRIYIGAAGRVEIYDAGGSHVGGFVAGEKKPTADITAIKILQNGILVADAAARVIRHYDAGGRQLGLIGNKSKAGGFMLPNRSLDIDVDTKGVIRATDTGRHQVTAWTVDGSPLGSFGKFGMSNPADFVGCCNPVNLAVTPDGKIVTGEKMVARVKVYEPDGRLLALIGPEQFDPNCIHIHLAVDSKGRILAGDPVRREIKVFSLVAKIAAGDRKPEEPENA